MHLFKDILVILLFLCSVTSTFIARNITDFSKCKVHYSRSDASYKQFFQVSDTLHRKGSTFDFHFSVLAPRDAHILLSPSAQITYSDPVYEIVLGAGMNTFSVIRRLQKAAAKQSQSTPNLLTSLDIKSFWIHVSEDGLIEVGKDGAELAFLSWRDPDPVPIEVFSFCTWPGVDAKWYYDCVREDGTTSESQEIEEKLTTTEKLRKGLLKYYDPYAIPIIQPDDVIEINLGLLYERVYLDEINSKLIIDGTMQLEWYDPKISWLPSEFDNIKNLHFNFREIWQPDLMLYNSASGPGNNFLKSTNFNVDSEGQVFWVAQAHIETWCDASGLGQWPNDEHTCEIQIGFWTQQNYLFIQPYENGSLIQKYKEWEITNVQAGYYLIPTPWDIENSITSTFVIQFTLRRTTGTYTAVYFVPLVAVSISLLLTFWLSPTGPVRISLHCFQLVILSLMLTKLGSVVPAHPTHAPYIVLLYSYGFVAISVALVFTIILFNWSHTQHTKPLPYFLYKILSMKYVQTILYVKGSKFSESYDKLIEEEPCNKEVDIQEMWRMLGIAIDRLLFFSYLLLILICLGQHY